MGGGGLVLDIREKPIVVRSDLKLLDLYSPKLMS